jgi:hypothetical protein
VRFRVHRIFVLVRIAGIGNLAGQFLGHRIITARVFWLDRRRANDHFGAQRLQRVDLLARLLIIDGEHHLVAARGGHQRQPHAGISGSAFNDGPAGLEQPAAFGIVDHRDGYAVLHRTAGVHVLGFDVHLGGHAFGDPVQPDERRVAYRFQYIFAFHADNSRLTLAQLD